MQAIANKLPDAFNDAVKVTKSHIPTVNSLARIHVLGKLEEMDNNISRLKHGRLIGSKNATPRKKREGRNLLF